MRKNVYVVSLVVETMLTKEALDLELNGRRIADATIQVFDIERVKALPTRITIRKSRNTPRPKRKHIKK